MDNSMARIPITVLAAKGRSWPNSYRLSKIPSNNTLTRRRVRWTKWLEEVTPLRASVWWAATSFGILRTLLATNIFRPMWTRMRWLNTRCWRLLMSNQLELIFYHLLLAFTEIGLRLEPTQCSWEMLHSERVQRHKCSLRASTTVIPGSNWSRVM